MPLQFLPICSLTEEPKRRYNAKNGFLKPLQTVDKLLCKDKMGCLMLFAWSVLHPCKTLGKQLKHPCFRRSPNASLRSFVGFASVHLWSCVVGASCTDSVRPLVSIRAYNLCANAIKHPCLVAGCVSISLTADFQKLRF